MANDMSERGDIGRISKATLALLCVLVTVGIAILPGMQAGATELSAIGGCSGNYPISESVGAPLGYVVGACLTENEQYSVVENDSTSLVIGVQTIGSDIRLQRLTVPSGDAPEAPLVAAGYQSDGSVILLPGASVTGPPRMELTILPALTAQFEVLKSLYLAAQDSVTPRIFRTTRSVTQCAVDVSTEVQSYENQDLADDVINGYSSYSQCKSAAKYVIGDGKASVPEERSGLESLIDSIKGGIGEDAVDDLAALAVDVR
jgi:hypothetical protein